MAIVAFVGYRYLLSRSNRHSVDLEESALELFNILRENNGGEEADADEEKGSK